jgi:hypothetical protein
MSKESEYLGFRGVLPASIASKRLWYFYLSQRDESVTIP